MNVCLSARWGMVGLELVSLAVVASLLTSGCSVSGTAESQPSVTLVASTVYPGAYRVPEEAVTGVDPAQDLAIKNRISELIGQCMSVKGFTYKPDPSSQVSPGPSAIYGAVDPDWASVYGYASPDWVALEKAGVNQNDTGGSMPSGPAVQSSYDAALLGVADETVVRSESGKIVGRYRADGCYWKGTLAVQPDYARAAEPNNQFLDAVNASHEAVVQSGEYLSSQSKWVSCMAKYGYSVSDPVGMPGVDTTEISAATIAEARMDIKCKNSTGFLKVWSRLLAEEETNTFNALPGLIEGLVETHKDDYRRATDGQ